MHQSFPYVSFEFPDYEPLKDHYKKRNSFRIEREDIIDNLRKKYPKASKGELVDIAFKIEPKKMLKATENYVQAEYWICILESLAADELLAPLNELLDQFYKQHSCKPDQKLMFTHIPRTTLVSNGAQSKSQLPSSLQEIKRKEYQQEMREFTRFLKTQFFSNKNNQV